MQLPNNCRIGKIGVTPKNWNTSKADPKKDWRIFYEFHDGNLNETKQIPVRGMNTHKTLKEKQGATKRAIETQLELLKGGYNPITKNIILQDDFYEDQASMNLQQSLNYAFAKINATPEHVINTRSAKKYFLQAAQVLNYHNIPIKEITRRHLKLILEKCKSIKEKWNNAMYNDYRTLIASLFKILQDEDIIHHNIMLDVPKLKKVVSPRRVMTPEQLEALDANEYNLPYELWRYLWILKFSGSRIIELLRIKKEHIDLRKREFTVLVKKGRSERHEPRAILKLPFTCWEELYNLAGPDEYIFGEGLVPQLRNKPIRREQITRRWKRHLKNKHGIIADVYSLKHSFLEKLAKKYGIERAQKAAGHSTPVVTMNHYAIGEKQRQLDYLKEVDL